VPTHFDVQKIKNYYFLEKSQVSNYFNPITVEDGTGTGRAVRLVITTLTNTGSLSLNWDLLSWMEHSIPKGFWVTEFWAVLFPPPSISFGKEILTSAVAKAMADREDQDGMDDAARWPRIGRGNVR
jgi:hypothetical protein